MVLTATQTTAFFENEDQIGIPRATVVQLIPGGITSVIDLADFDKESLQQLADKDVPSGFLISTLLPNQGPRLQHSQSFLEPNPSSSSL
jgi:hypothetical protein